MATATPSGLNEVSVPLECCGEPLTLTLYTEPGATTRTTMTLHCEVIEDARVLLERHRETCKQLWPGVE